VSWSHQEEGRRKKMEEQEEPGKEWLAGTKSETVSFSPPLPSPPLGEKGRRGGGKEGSPTK